MILEKSLTRFTKLSKLKFYLGILFGFLSGVVLIFQSLLLSRIISEVILQHKNLSYEKPAILLFFLLTILRFIFSYLQSYFSYQIALLIKEKIRAEILDKLNSEYQNEKNENLTGEIVNLILIGVNKLEDYFVKYLPQIYLAALIPILIILVVLPLDIISSVIFIVTAPIIILFMFLIGSASDKMNKKQFETLGRMSSYFFDVIKGIPTIKIFNIVDDTITKIKEISSVFKTRTLKVLKIAFISALILELASSISVALIAVGIGLRLIYNSFQFNDALFILLLAPEFYLPIRQLGAAYHLGMDGIASFDRIKNYLPKSKIKYEKPSHEELFSDINKIELRNVTVSFNHGENIILQNINCTFPGGKFSALLGKSGVGKSTLINIILGLVQPVKGELIVNDYVINQLNMKSWRKKISWMPQKPYLFNDTIYNNIKFANPLATDYEINIAADKAGLFDFVSNLQTKIGEDAVRFSGGEAQRIALARIFVRDSHVIIVDEPTANLDPITEEEILNKIFNYSTGKTLIISAQNINAIKKADVFFYINENTIKTFRSYDLTKNIIDSVNIDN